MASLSAKNDGYIVARGRRAGSSILCVRLGAGIGNISSTESGFKSSISSASHMTKSAMVVSSEARVTEAPMAVRAGTVNRTVTGSSPVAGAIESLGSPRLFYFHCIGDQTRHPIINREIHGEDLTTTHIRQTGHCQFTDERRGISQYQFGNTAQILHRDLGQGHGGVDREVGGAGGHAGFDQVHAEHGDHGTVVGAELDLRDADVDTVILAEFE